jgi:hypothetical protein
LSAHTIGHQLITTAEGHTLHLKFNDYHAKNRVMIYGSYGQYANGQHIQTNEEQPTITASLTRSPAAIAQDIKSRFMPQFLKAKAEAEAKREADDKAILWAVEKARFLIAHFGYWIEGKARDYDPAEMKNSHFNLHGSNLPTLQLSGTYKQIGTLYGNYIKSEGQLFEILELLTNKRIGKGRTAYRRSPRQQWKRQAVSSAPTKSSQAATAALLYV